MATPTTDDLLMLPTIRFPQGNSVTYGCDFSFYRGVPANVDWYIAKVEGGDVTLVRPGYGIQGDYGNGSLHVKADHIWGPQSRLERQKDAAKCDDLVEWVASALLKFLVGADAWDDFREKSKPHYRAQARAALASIEAAGYVVVPREPTNRMLKASCSAMSEGKRPTPDRVSSKEKHRIRYRAMIDAALEKDKANVG